MAEPVHDGIWLEVAKAADPCSRRRCGVPTALRPGHRRRELAWPMRLLLRAQASVCAALGGARHGSNQFVLMLSWPGGARGPEWSPT